MYKVQKKDGTYEDFDRNKLISGAIRAGATQEQAEQIAGEIEAWLPSVAVNGIVSSLDIRNKGLEILRTLNPEAAASFESYKKPTG